MNANIPAALEDSRLVELAAEIAAYQRELPRLLAEGHAGRHAVIHGDQIISIWDTYPDAIQYAHERFSLETKFAVKEIDARDVDRFAQLLENPHQSCPS